MQWRRRGPGRYRCPIHLPVILFSVLSFYNSVGRGQLGSIWEVRSDTPFPLALLLNFLYGFWPPKNLTSLTSSMHGSLWRTQYQWQDNFKKRSFKFNFLKEQYRKFLFNSILIHKRKWFYKIFRNFRGSAKWAKRCSGVVNQYPSLIVKKRFQIGLNGENLELKKSRDPIQYYNFD